MGAFVLVLAFWCKEPALFFLAIGAVLVWRVNRKAAVLYGVVAAVGVLVPFAVLHVTTGGWSTFSFVSLARIPLRPANLLPFLLRDVLLTWWPLLILGSGWGLLPEGDRWYVAALVAAGLAAAGPRLRSGG